MSVYFITCRKANAVKIGNSYEPHKRLGEVQWGCPLELVLEAVWPGSSDEEFALHRRFADDRIRGEWFNLTPIIEAIIAASSVPPPPVKPDPIPHNQRIKRCREAWVSPERERYETAMAEMRAGERA